MKYAQYEQITERHHVELSEDDVKAAIAYYVKAKLPFGPEIDVDWDVRINVKQGFIKGAEVSVTVDTEARLRNTFEEDG